MSGNGTGGDVPVVLYDTTLRDGTQGENITLSLADKLRIARLLEFAGQLSVELPNLSERGLWAVSRVDEFYPSHLRERLKHQAPSVLFGAGDIQLLQRAGAAVIGSR